MYPTVQASTEVIIPVQVVNDKAVSKVKKVLLAVSAWKQPVVLYPIYGPSFTLTTVNPWQQLQPCQQGELPNLSLPGVAARDE